MPRAKAPRVGSFGLGSEGGRWWIRGDASLGRTRPFNDPTLAYGVFLAVPPARDVALGTDNTEYDDRPLQRRAAVSFLVPLALPWLDRCPPLDPRR
jgi:hypothetical protein